MEKNAKEVHAEETERRDCRLRLLSSPTDFRAVIKNEKFTVQVEGDTFAITSRD